MDLLIDYRPALRARTGVGEYLCSLTEALLTTAVPDEQVWLFTSSFKDRPDPSALSALAGARVIDRRIPVQVLTWAWHRLEWPPVEWLTLRPFTVAHSFHPLLLPARSAAQVVTIHDLDFLDHPRRTRGEIRRDYPALARRHAAAADGVLVPSEATARQVETRLGIERRKIAVCPPAPPRWTRSARARDWSPAGPILFVGTLEPRKNVGALLDAYERLLSAWPEAPSLLLVGASAPGAEDWLARLNRPPLAGRARWTGYVPDSERRAHFESASVLVLPSWNEGFGLPVLEAMAIGVPVVASNAGALPEVLGPAGALVDPADSAALADAIAHVLRSPGAAAACLAAGRARAARWSPDEVAGTLRRLYQDARVRRAQRDARRR